MLLREKKHVVSDLSKEVYWKPQNVLVPSVQRTEFSVRCVLHLASAHSCFTNACSSVIIIMIYHMTRIH